MGWASGHALPAAKLADTDVELADRGFAVVGDLTLRVSMVHEQQFVSEGGAFRQYLCILSCS